ncbi:hypothetical protein C2G38_2224350 [Gigaspora rosea]|uniref:Uncharacterized protein n=1 Tax=Gigaspora rosea TaxID=44941 RepID=A0A397U0G1_9GLOM|nr:hypothetical protein C2G38_2224350 [Gigaspora rosea]
MTKPDKTTSFVKFRNVNMLLYKTDNTTGLPILYLQDHKKALWNKFHKKYPNGMQCTTFMTRLEGSRFVYKENLSGLCSTCNELGYKVFEKIELLIDAQIKNNGLKCKDFAANLKVSPTGAALHSPCISHCLQQAFNSCHLDHPKICENCDELFTLFKNLKTNIDSEFHNSLTKYQSQLIYFMAHHARKTYLNALIKVELARLDANSALLIVDYKMRILPQNAPETKSEFFGKRGWTLHSVLIYTKNTEINNLDIQAFDHWSNDTKQDACNEWYISNYTDNSNAILETITGIRNLHEWSWPDDEAEIGYDSSVFRLVDRYQPVLNRLSKPGTDAFFIYMRFFFWLQLQKTSIVMLALRVFFYRISLNVKNNSNDDLETINLTDTAEIEVFVAGWCRKEKHKRKSIKRLPPQVKSLLETMFHTGTATPRNKMLATEMQQELLISSQEGEIGEADVPKVSTISNWISGFSRTWKRAMAECSLDE